MFGLGALFSYESIVRPQERRGPLPTRREGYRDLSAIAWPSMIEALLVCAVSFADMAMVGVLGHEAISAVGITNQPKYILLAAVLSLNVGLTAVVARRKGEDNREGANRCMKQCILICTVLAAVLSLAGIAFARPFLMLAGAGEDILPDATVYFQIVMAGFLFYSLTLTINAAQRGCGNTRVSMTTNLTANVVNIVFNYLLIQGIGPFPRLEVAGAAIATSLGYTVSFVLAVLSVLKKNSFVTLRTRAQWRFDRGTMRSVGRVAGSAMVEQICLRAGFFIYARMVAELGTLAFATHQICLNIINISFAVGDGLSVGASSLVGQSLGAERPDKAKLYGAIAQRVSLLLSTALLFLFFFGRYALVGLFDKDPLILAEGAKVMIVIALSTHVQTSQVVLSGCLRGAGDTRYTAAISLLSIAIIRPALTWALCFPLGWGLIGAWIALFLDQVMRATANTIRFHSGKWANIRI